MEQTGAFFTVQQEGVEGGKPDARHPFPCGLPKAFSKAAAAAFHKGDKSVKGANKRQLE